MSEVETRITYYASGANRSSADYASDKLHGKSKGWYESGQLVYEQDWMDGKLQ